MSSLYLDRRNLALKLEGRTLTIYADGVHQTTVPLHMLERVVFYSAVQIESSLLARLADAGISVIALGGRNAGKVAIVQGAAHNDGARRIGQYRRYADPDWRRQWSRQLVLGKLKGQARLLHRAIFWAAGKESELKKWFCDNPVADCAFYPNSRQVVVVNNSDEAQETRLFDGTGRSRRVALKPYQSRWLRV